MKMCSYCGAENADDAVCCKECGTDFEAPLRVDPQLTDPNRDLVVVATFADLAQASLLKDRLAQAGIEACIPEELNPGVFAGVTALSSVTVRVAEKDYETARQIVSEAG